jgi:hypothetical protein
MRYRNSNSFFFNTATFDTPWYQSPYPQLSLLWQVLATMACNMVALDIIITFAFSTVVIAQLHRSEGQNEFSLDDVQASWIGKF